MAVSPATDDEVATCWLHADGWCLSRRDV